MNKQLLASSKQPLENKYPALSYTAAFVYKQQHQEEVIGKLIRMQPAAADSSLVTDVIVTPFGYLNKVLHTMKTRSMTNEEALAFLEKDDCSCTVYVVNTEKNTLLHVNLLKYLAHAG
ncbi:hypothetical protein I5907_20110 [Panacibacter sp. DH6]|uniref:Uncharacterized protein n=1 Tax=Panacibacter microcysteis TaxID=2793269 RepID=A0A931H035_9BACT|nr:hypothetical protein [Panacibacter microcysteis]MBG9378551.1 hypothetical protein [Panacibacter microcysteis]